MPLRQKHGGFTLLEILVTVGILALLASFLWTGISAVRKRSMIVSSEARFARWVFALKQYRLHYGRYPAFLYQMPNPTPGNTLLLGQLNSEDDEVQIALVQSFFATLAGKNPDSTSNFSANPQGKVFYRFANDEFDHLSEDPDERNRIRLLDLFGTEGAIYIVFEPRLTGRMEWDPTGSGETVIVEDDVAIWSVPFEDLRSYPKSWRSEKE